MRLALLVASLLVLSGCAAEPVETAAPSAQVSQQAEDDSSMDLQAESSEDEGSIESEPVDSEGTEDSDEERNDEDESEGESEAESEAESEDEPRETQDTEPTQDPEPSQEQSPEPEPSPTAEDTFQGYTLAEVSERDSAAECWVAIDAGVYDLTEWIRSHPGGSGAILNLCGKDGTTSFTSQHGGQARPSSTLDGYYLAPLNG
jgi:cytochrome b involved in lipid metabolism